MVSRFFKNEIIKHPIYLRLQKGGEKELSEIYYPLVEEEGFKYWEGEDILILTHGAITEEALIVRKRLERSISVAVLSILAWNNFSNLDIISKHSNIIFLEENRYVGSFASQIMKNHHIFKNKTCKILCVENANFDKNITRQYALRKNFINAEGLEIIINKIVNQN